VDAVARGFIVRARNEAAVLRGPPERVSVVVGANAPDASGHHPEIGVHVLEPVHVPADENPVPAAFPHRSCAHTGTIKHSLCHSDRFETVTRFCAIRADGIRNQLDQELAANACHSTSGSLLRSLADGLRPAAGRLRALLLTRPTLLDGR